MSWNDGLTKLRNLLMELCPTIADSRAVIEDAGMPTRLVEFDAAAKRNWHKILKEADTRRMVPEIVSVAVVEYPERFEELAAAEAEYLKVLKY